MLGFILRGIFLIGVLTWYSTSVWKMIDGYFRDQFRTYLEDEYRKNPRMRSDVESIAVDKTDPVATESSHVETTVAPSLNIDESSVKTVEVSTNGTIAALESNEVSRVTDENGTVWESDDKNTFQQSAATSGLESRKSYTNEQDSGRFIDQNVDNHRSITLKCPRRRLNLDGKLFPSRKRVSWRKRFSARAKLRRKKESKSFVRNRVSNDDFWEFEEDAIGKVSMEGILVSELPFKPRADIGDLEVVNMDEYCPLSAEDEASCDETFKWP